MRPEVRPAGLAPATITGRMAQKPPALKNSWAEVRGGLTWGRALFTARPLCSWLNHDSRLLLARRDRRGDHGARRGRAVRVSGAGAAHQPATGARPRPPSSSRLRGGLEAITDHRSKEEIGHGQPDGCLISRDKPCIRHARPRPTPRRPSSRGASARCRVAARHQPQKTPARRCCRTWGSVTRRAKEVATPASTHCHPGAGWSRPLPAHASASWLATMPH